MKVTTFIKDKRKRPRYCTKDAVIKTRILARQIAVYTLKQQKTEGIQHEEI